MFDIDLPGDPVELRLAADSQDELAATMGAARTLLATVDTSGLSGTAADAVHAKLKTVLDGLDSDRAGYTGLGRQLRAAADTIEDKRKELRLKIAALAAGAATAAVVGFALTWLTGGVSTIAGEWAAGVATGAVVTAAAAATAELVGIAVTAVTWVATTFTIGLIEGITFTLVQEGVLGQPIGISSNQWKQIAAIAAGNTFGKAAGALVGTQIGVMATNRLGSETLGTIAGGVAGGATAGGTLGLVNPILVSDWTGADSPDTAVVLGSAGINAALGAVGGGAMGLLSRAKYAGLTEVIRSGNRGVPSPAQEASATAAAAPLSGITAETGGGIQMAALPGQESTVVAGEIEGPGNAVIGTRVSASEDMSTAQGAQEQSVTLDAQVDPVSGNVTVNLSVTAAASDSTGAPVGPVATSTETTEIAPDGTAAAPTTTVSSRQTSAADAPEEGDADTGGPLPPPPPVTSQP